VLCITGFEIPQPGTVEVTVAADITKIGELNNKITPRLREIVTVFNEAGIPSNAVDNIQTYIWGKAFLVQCRVKSTQCDLPSALWRISAAPGLSLRLLRL